MQHVLMYVCTCSVYVQYCAYYTQDECTDMDDVIYK